jgi:hypothetical protein
VRAVWLLVSLFGGAMLDTASPPSQKTVMARAATCVARYTEELPRLVATETMTQQVTKLGQSLKGVRRQSLAEFGWVTISGVPEAIGFRDVIEVDGRPVGSGQTRLVDLLHGHDSGTWSQARVILDDGARHNLMPGSRNFNLPTVVLYFLEADRQSRFRWKRRSAASAPVWELEFHERSRPTVIRQTDGRPILSRGRVWIDTVTGAILRTALDLEMDPAGGYALTTTFERVTPMGLVLPIRLDERYTTPDEVVIGTATYTNYRRFQTGARLLP